MNVRRLIRIILILLSVCLLAASAAAAGAGVYLSRRAEEAGTITLPEPAVRCTGTPSALYASDASGEMTLVYVTPSRPEKRCISVTYGELPAYLVDAFVAVEDKRFYRHKGVDLVRTAHAAANYLSGRGRSFGGSTITQQLVKNLTGEDERTPDRKITELFRALSLEKNADKTEIMETYLNVINLANGCIGVGAAADYYFGKQTGELSLAECACLAAITNSPARYDPVTHPDNNRARRELILSLMQTQGYITEEERLTAAREEITIRPPDRARETGGTPEPASWYAELVISDVLRDLSDRLGMTREEAALTLYNGGLCIETCEDVDLQEAVEACYRDESRFPAGKNGRPQSALILIDPHTGAVLAAAGAVGEKSADRVQSFAWDTRRPAGSVIKPLSVFAPAVERGILRWNTVFADEPVNTDGGQPWPRNADGVYRGQVTTADALALSLNTVSVRLLDRVGREESFAFLRDTLHVTSLCPPSDSGAGDATDASLALGQQTTGVTLREMTAAYTVFLNGVWRAPVSYRRVTNGEGRVLLENPVGGEVVLSRETAAIMTKMMERVVTEGTASALTFTQETGIPCAGKTGTSQNNCDRWFIGYTPELLCGVWMGYEYPRPLDGIRGNPCLTVWNDVMRAAVRLRGRGENTFPLPSDIVRVTVCRTTGLIPDGACLDADTLTDGWFVRGTEPHDVCRGHEGTVIEQPPPA
ncbi:MAG: transglycosylase domain-containing protein [Clostridia bacterium]|nr:transglycosylase domain-containing protein [Clostridia bacterium]